ncbi:MAG: YgiQ family radical SAM protein, partial [Deltaproteobacteria bacterium]|nr:YgiQ family radical SAM protein [Deltaproteobacteria bacterium]
AAGFRVGIVAQPRWQTTADVARLGRPRLYAGVSAGALDSLLAHYTVFRKRRGEDAYTPGGRSGARPNRATLVYAGLVRQAFPGLPLVLGGIEASLRRAAHYDFWSNRLRRPLLLDAKADLVACGMGERIALELARRLAEQDAGRDRSGPGGPDGRRRQESGGRPPPAWVGVAGTAFVGDEGDIPPGAPLLRLPSYEQLLADPRLLLPATLTLEEQVQRGDCWAIQQVGARAVLFAPPAAVLSGEEMDTLYNLPFSRAAHPDYTEAVPALEMIRWSITAHRGCAGGCSFCALALHQGRRIASRSAASLLAEAERLTRLAGFSGSISDVGGPSANMWQTRCLGDPARCARRSCLFPDSCRQLRPAQAEYLRLLQAISALPGIAHVRIASGLRHDLALQEPDAARRLVEQFVGGQLKLAPEHCAPAVLAAMRKPPFAAFERFCALFAAASQQARREQYVVPYLISAFPGCTEQQMHELRGWLDRRGWAPQQVQCFVPTPGTVATAMFVAGTDAAGRPIHVARSDAERLRQHRILAGEPRGRPHPHPQPRPHGAGPAAARRGRSGRRS